MERNSPWRGGVDRDREEQNPRKPRWRLRGEEAWAAWPGGCYRIGLNQDPNPQTVGSRFQLFGGPCNSAWNFGLVSSVAVVH
jgi:hypothetical protein